MALEDVDGSRNANHQQEVIKDTAGIIFAGTYTLMITRSLTTDINKRCTAGADTTTSAIHTFFLAMICFPEVQIKAQAEIDRVVNGRLPDFSDMPDLPYVSAIVKEVLR